MSSTPYELMQNQQSATPWRQWLPIALGLLLLFVPTYYDISREFWAYERGSHGPIILLIVAWLFWRDRSALIDRHDPRPILGGTLVGVALIFYMLGRSQGVIQFEAGAQIPLLAGIVLCLCGTRAMRRLWFPILFLAFLVPLPGSLLDAVLLPLKQLVSQVVEQIVYSLGYPIARTGVVLIIGPYQLLIADACSGLNSMIALSGIGLLYVYIAGHSNRAHNLLLLASVLPIAFLANILRVLLLMFVTYYYGDGTGQAFHNQAGYLEIVFAFGAFFALDALLSAFFQYRKRRAAHA